MTAFAGSADWIGWAYRLIEVGGAATAVLLLAARGNWHWDVGALSLVVEVAMVLVSVGVLLGSRLRRPIRDDGSVAPDPSTASALARRT